MVAPVPVYQDELTGRLRFRRSFGRLVVQVEVETFRVESIPPSAGEPRKKLESLVKTWRDAKETDIDDPFAAGYFTRPKGKS